MTSKVWSMSYHLLPFYGVINISRVSVVEKKALSEEQLDPSVWV